MHKEGGVNEMGNGIIHMVFWCVVLVAALLLIERKNICNAKKVKRVVVIIIILLWIATSVFPPELLFMEFSSPEQAFQYTHSVEPPYYVIAGEETDLVYGIDQDGACVLDITRRTDDGWRAGNILATKNLVFSVNEGVHIQIYKHKETGECYLLLLCPNYASGKIYDERGSVFLLDPYSVRSNEYGFVKYYSYIGIPEDEYVITVGEETYNLLVQ